jgi:hypothetical protein
VPGAPIAAGAVAAESTAAGAAWEAAPMTAGQAAEAVPRAAEPGACPAVVVEAAPMAAGAVAAESTAAGAAWEAEGPANPAAERARLVVPPVRDSVRWSAAESGPPPIRELPPASPARLPGAATPFPEPVVPRRPWRPLHCASQVGRPNQPSRPGPSPCGVPAAARASWRRWLYLDRCVRPGTPSDDDPSIRPSNQRPKALASDRVSASYTAGPCGLASVRTSFAPSSADRGRGGRPGEAAGGWLPDRAGAEPWRSRGGWLRPGR